MELRGVIKIMTPVLSIRPTFWFQTNRDKRLKLYSEPRWGDDSVSQTRTCNMQSAEKRRKSCTKVLTQPKWSDFDEWRSVLFSNVPPQQLDLNYKYNSFILNCQQWKFFALINSDCAWKNKSLQNAAHQSHVQPLKSVKSDSLPDWGTARDVFLEPGSLGVRTMECWEDV